MSPKKSTSADADLATSVRNVMGDGVAALRKRMATLTKAKASAENAAEILRLTNALGPLLGQLRRHDEATAAAGDRHTPASVIAYLRKLPPVKRDAILAEVTGDDEDDRPDRSVLS